MGSSMPAPLEPLEPLEELEVEEDVLLLLGTPSPFVVEAFGDPVDTVLLPPE